jgi:hypothetical protein
MLSREAYEKQLEEADRIGGRDSLFYLARFILGYELMQEQPHLEVCQFLESIVKTHKRGLDLEPRGSFKTTQASQALPIWLILNDPNIRILLTSAVLQNSMDNLGVIARQLEGNEKLRYLFGDYVGKHWNSEEITVSKRNRPNLKEPTVRCASVDRIQVGPHYDVIIPDDLVSENNSTTEEGRRKVKDHFRLLFSLLEPGGVMIVEGTRWHYDDLYGLIIDEYPDFVKRIKCAGGINCTTHKAPLYFPQRLSDEELAKIRKIQTRDIYSCQYENDPAPEDADAAFQASLFKRFTKLPENRLGFIAIDPGGEKKGSDEWAMMSSYCDDENRRYLDALRRGHWRVDQAWDEFFLLAAIVKPHAVGLETTGGQKYLLESLYAEMRRRNKFYNVVALPHAAESKQDRIKGTLQPLYKAGAIFHSSEMGPLEDQLRRFPKGKDDVADVASMTQEITIIPGHKKPAASKPKSMDEMLIQMHRDRLAGRGPSARHVVLGDNW